MDLKKGDGIIKKVARLVVIASIVTLAIVTWLHLETVEFDAGGCSGGFKKWVSDKYADEFSAMFLEKQKVDSKVSVIGSNEIQQLTQNMTWNDRIIRTECRITFKGREYLVEYRGQRYWIERYRWQIVRLSRIN